MKVLVLGEEDRLVVRTKPDPVADLGYVIIDVERCGVCGSDLKLWRTHNVGKGCVLGHEISGTVASIGADVPGLFEGQRVGIMPTRRCGTCTSCRNSANANRTMVMCERYSEFLVGIDEKNDGGFAEYVRVPWQSCVPIADDMSFEQASLAEPYAVALHSVLRSRVAENLATPVGVIGAGPIGLMALSSLVHLGAQRIAVAERSEPRRESARKLGAHAVVADLADINTALGDPLQVWIDFTGSSATPQMGMDLLQPGGQIIIVGIDPTTPIALNSGTLLHKEIEVRASCGYSEAEYARSIDEISGGAIDMQTVLTGVQPLEDGEEVFASLATNAAAAKIQLAP